jgi:hypothetical protein
MMMNAFFRFGGGQPLHKIHSIIFRYPVTELITCFPIFSTVVSLKILLCSMYPSLDVFIVMCIQTLLSLDVSECLSPLVAPCLLTLKSPFPTLGTHVLNKARIECRIRPLLTRIVHICTQIFMILLLCTTSTSMVFSESGFMENMNKWYISSRGRVGSTAILRPEELDNQQIQLPQPKSNPQYSGLSYSAWTNYATACPWIVIGCTNYFTETEKH